MRRVIRSLTDLFEAQCNGFVKFNESKTKTMIVSGSRTIHPQSISMTLNETEVKESGDLVILRVTFGAKMTFEKHLRSVSRAAAQWLGIIRKFRQVFHDRSLLLKSSSWWCFRVQPCSSTVCNSVVHAIED